MRGLVVRVVDNLSGGYEHRRLTRQNIRQSSCLLLFSTSVALLRTAFVLVDGLFVLELSFFSCFAFENSIQYTQ